MTIEQKLSDVQTMVMIELGIIAGIIVVIILCMHFFLEKPEPIE
jgi:hypothetical protein